MANYIIQHSSGHIDAIFSALSDPTRRDILKRLSEQELTVSKIADSYTFALPTISKHLTVLEKAQLIKRTKIGREYKVNFQPQTMRRAAEYISFYKKYWNQELDQLEQFLARGVKKNEKKRT